VRRFEREFLQFVETNYPSVLKNIAAKKALDDGIKAEIKTALDAFKEPLYGCRDRGKELEAQPDEERCPHFSISGAASAR